MRFQTTTAMLTAALLGLSACTADNASTPNTQSTNTPTTPIAPAETTPATKLVANINNTDVPALKRTFTQAACSLGTNTTRAGGKVYNVNLQSASGQNIAFTVFEPKSFDCAQGNPLMLHGHGYGGSRETTPTGLIQRMVDAGAGAISIDLRGFGESGGSVRVMDPDFEGQDLLQIIDWAEANLDWLRYSNDKPVGSRKLNPVIGSTGGSYGGGYQLLIHNIDPFQRLDALTPDITWNDLRYSLNPGGPYGQAGFKPSSGQITPAGTIKTGWALALVAGGESGSYGPKVQAGNPQAAADSGQDNLVRETLIRGAASNRIPTGALEFFRYHSPSYWCDSEKPGEQSFLNAKVTPKYLPKKPVGVDILFTQGFRDTLFNFNDGWHNFACYRSLKRNDGTPADVRLLTHQSGHILPVSPDAAPGLGDLANQGAQSGLNRVEFQRPAGPFACGDLSIPDAQFAFLAKRLFTAAELTKIQAAKPNNAFAQLDANKGKVCLSLTDDVGASKASSNAARWVNETEVIGLNGPSAKGTAIQSRVAPVSFDLQPNDPANAVLNAAAGVVRYPLKPAVAVLNLPAGAKTLAGIGTATVDIAPAVGGLQNPACAALQSRASQSPVGVVGLELGCDPIVFLGLGVERNGSWQLIDDQVTAVRGFGKRAVELTGVAEVIAANEKLGLLVYGYHPQYLGTASRDLATPAVRVSGTLSLPILPQ